MKTVSLLAMLRPRQWSKNLILFFPPFLSGSLFSAAGIPLRGLLPFVSFCFISSAMYVANDLKDINKDLLHPVKRLRPLPSGSVSKQAAVIMAIFLGVAGLLIAVFLARPLVPYLILYCAVTMAYTTWLKNVPVVDLFCISCGFLIRLQAGGAVFRVEISEWLFLSVFFLSLFLSAGKRLSEQNLLGADAAGHRTSLDGYPEGTLSGMVYVTAATVLVTYTMYTLAHPQLVYTVPLCAFGLFRYIMRVNGGGSGDPTECLFKDLPLRCVSILWALLVWWSIYW